MNDKKAMILAFAVFAVMIAVGAAGFIGADEADAETGGKFIVTGGGETIPLMTPSKQPSRQRRA